MKDVKRVSERLWTLKRVVKITGSGPVSASQNRVQVPEVSRVYIEGIVAGLIGAATIAIWFLLLDALNGRPLHTPTVLGTAVFRQSAGLDAPEKLDVSFEMVLMYTWVHTLIFCVIGGFASKLIALAERDASLGFGILLFFVFFEFGFIVVAFVLAEPVLHVLAWPAILVGNLLAAGTMGSYFWRHHPNLLIRP
jgi:hypothetical protein